MIISGSCSTTTTVFLIGAQRWRISHQAAAVARMQTDGRLVEDVERIDQRRADRSGEIDALQFAAGKRARLAIESEIFQTDADEIATRRRISSRIRLATWSRAPAGLQFSKKPCAAPTLMRAHLRDVSAFNPIIQRVGFEPAALAFRAHQVGAVARQQHAHVHAVAFALQAAKPAADAFDIRRRRR